nr:alpha/beta hydrolase [Altericroceibacterium endophyticum]
MTLPVLLLPGIGGSGPDHWQSHWERTDPDMTRFAPSDWDRPELADWCEALDRAVKSLDSSPILVAHSLACLLVAVPDPCGQAFPDEARSFAQVLEQPPAVSQPDCRQRERSLRDGRLQRTARRAVGLAADRVGSARPYQRDQQSGRLARGPGYPQVLPR